MRWSFALALALVPALLLPGCTTPSPYFPPADSLPGGVATVPKDDDLWRLSSAYLGVSDNPGHVGNLKEYTERDGFPGLDSADLWMLKDSFASSTETSYFSIIVLKFPSAESVPAEVAHPDCENFKAGHLLEDGAVVVWVIGSPTTLRAQQVMDGLADAVAAHSAATLAC